MESQGIKCEHLKYSNIKLIFSLDKLLRICTFHCNICAFSLYLSGATGARGYRRYA
jgi:hypothetical protein